MSVVAEPALDVNLPALNEMLEPMDPQRIVSWACAEFGDGLIMSSSFGAESALLLHLATQAKPNIRIIFVDTGYLFPETHRFMEQLRQRFNLNVWTYRTQNDPIGFLHHAGEENWKWRKDIEACCAANKTEPMQRAIRELAPRAWFRGIRRNQADSRRDARFLEWDRAYQCYAISPLLNWTSREIHAYMKQHDLPYHPLTEKGYLSVGCNPLSCTRPVAEGEDPRSGRWTGSGKLECGINMGSLDSANQI